MKVIEYRLFIVFIIAFFFTYCNSNQNATNNSSNISKKLIQTEQNNIDTSSATIYFNNKLSYRIFYSEKEATGFGYEIFVDNLLYIRQPTIPAINGHVAFKSKEEAIRVAEFAAKKMDKNEGLPTIDIKDLDSLKISY